ncbi:MAG: hypothetical protein R6U38_05250 [Desulfatiglandaceae bacterium]
MQDKSPDFGFMATGIGSVPFTDIGGTCLKIVERFPGIPFWPQFVKRSVFEDMSIQYSEGLPLLTMDPENRSLVMADSLERESALAEFYGRFLSQETEYFKITREFAPGLYTLIESVETAGEKCGPYIKGQTVGPVTFTAGILGLDGNAIVHDPELSEAMANGLAIKALWQARTLAETGKRPIIFLDEPYLSGFGSAFSPIGRSEVIDLLRIPMNYLRAHSDTLIGVHCCGNTDWSMILEAGPDIVNFDAFDYMNHFLLYPDPIKAFLEQGGTIAWGVAPTSNFNGDETVEQLFSILKKGLKFLQEKGVSMTTLSRKSMLTPSCGMGTMSPDAAEAVMDLLCRLSHRMKGGHE